MMVILSIIMTGLVMTIAWSASVQSRSTATVVRSDQAYAAAESAGQIGVWKFKKDNAWRQNTAPNTLPTVSIGGNTYQYAMTVKDAGAEADLYWPFKEGSGSTTADTSGHNNTGTLIGGVQWVNPGRFDKCLVFDGVSGYVDAGNDPSTNITSSVTMCAWVKMNSPSQDQKVGGNQDGVKGGYKMSIYNSKVEFEVRDNSNVAWLNRAVSGGTTLNMGVWYHVTGVYNTSTQTIRTYLNGKFERELGSIPSGSLGSTGGHFRMGREPWDVGAQTRFFDGMIDDVRVYARALSDSEIKTLADTSVKIDVKATLVNSAYPYPPTNAVSFVSSIPTALPPTAPTITVGGNLPMTRTTVNGDVQVTGNMTAGSNASTINGIVNYGGTYSDPSNRITIKGTPTTPTKKTGLTVPTVDYANIQAKASQTGTAGTGKTYKFGYLDGQINICYVNGDVTDPIIDTTESGGTVLINGTLTITKDATFGSNGFPAYVIVQKGVSHTGGKLTVNGALYIKDNFVHRDVVINGLTVVGGSVTDNTPSASVFTYGGIPWFDTRSSAPTTPQAIYYTSSRGANP
jgi:hypothetical protein